MWGQRHVIISSLPSAPPQDFHLCKHIILFCWASIIRHFFNKYVQSKIALKRCWASQFCIISCHILTGWFGSHCEFFFFFFFLFIFCHCFKSAISQCEIGLPFLDSRPGFSHNCQAEIAQAPLATSIPDDQSAVVLGKCESCGVV